MGDLSQRRTFILSAGSVLILVLLTVFLQSSWTPRFHRLSPDSGAFAYGGSQILDGRLLYRDVWDNKPPGVFYLNALAIFVFGETPWAVWWAGILWIIASLVAIYAIIRRLVGLLPALFASLVFLMLLHYPDYYLGGNFTEIYALLPQVLVIGALERSIYTHNPVWIGCCGVLTSIALIFKPTYIALGFASLAVLIYFYGATRGMRGIRKVLAIYFLGAVLPLLPIAIYWGLHHALDNLMDAVFISTYEYSQQWFSIRTLFTTIRMFIIEPPMSQIVIISITSMTVYLYNYWAQIINILPRCYKQPVKNQIARMTDESNIIGWVYAGVFVALVLEFGLTAISGRNLGHYFITPLPALAAACSYLIYEVMRAINERGTSGFWRFFSLTLLAILSVSWSIEVFSKDSPNKDQLKALLSEPLNGQFLTIKLDEYIIENSQPTESVLVWGVHPGINFVTQRRSPTRYLHMTSILMPSANRNFMFDTFMDDLQHDPPALIIAQPQSSAGIPYFSVEEANLCPTCTPNVRERLSRLKKYVNEYYAPVLQINEWQIFKHK